eukprot:COSAG05_NODE_1615_length_4399_cov_1.770000_6_plen_37_part_01
MSAVVLEAIASVSRSETVVVVAIAVSPAGHRSSKVSS